MAVGSYLFWGSVIGAILMFLYVLAAYGATSEGESETRPDLGKAVGVFLAANGITASIRLFVVAFTEESLGVLNDADRLYLVVGAIAAFWLSWEAIIGIFVNASSSRPASPENAEGEPGDDP